MLSNQILKNKNSLSARPLSILNFSLVSGLAVVFCVLSASLTGCVSAFQNPNLPSLISEPEYFSDVDQFSSKQKVYDGFYETMEVSGVLLNTKVSRAQLDQKARIFQWTVEQYSAQKAELESNLSKRTSVFLSFFVPERKHDDLHKPKTLWRIYLDVGGRRFEGKAEKHKTILADVTSLYPNHTRFSTPYHIHFPVPVSMVENADSKMTLTGPVGTTVLTFPASH